ncbi:VirD4-like conjugal transfer protein, CD1115 family [Bacillus sp. 37MA]|uniref:VirD4-like conjugal transfer protein, CD1115 family n=1 Tax=Bacillus sp. 37MA TaxID=1132442 RepID=UPI00068461C0|nr:type IV secretory system conjugative DNA transfer family protein [Bacillus sp. 37MA]
MGAFLFISILLLGNFLVNTILTIKKNLFRDFTNPQPLSISKETFFHISYMEYPFIFLMVLIIATIAVIKITYDIRSNFKDLNHNQKGSSRFTELAELKAQYKAVPDRKDQYKGGGGVVISSYKHKVFIDDSPVNNLIIGTTRSGKGETFVFPTIDVYSRAEQQPSLILNDPKGELFAASKETLEERGYHIEVLNLLNPVESMSYNLLQLIKDAYEDRDYSTAQSLCNTLSHTLYYNPNAKDPFWQQCAMSLCNAMILAVTDKCINEKTEEKITMYAVANMLSGLGSKEELDDRGELQNALDMYFQSLPADSVAKMQYATSNFSKGTTRGGIFTQTMNGLSIFTFDENAKMTSKNSIDLKRIGFGKTIKGTVHPFSQVEITFADGTREVLKSDKAGRFELNFKQSVHVGDSIHVVDRGENNKSIYRVKEMNEKTGETILETVLKSDSIHVKEIRYFNKPVAVFMITPDYDSSNHVIASIFVRQLYFVLAKYASLARGGKCHREVVFLLDEFGNMPSIEGMANIVTVCLGRNIRFNLIIQAYAQLKNKYGDDAPTIDGNCGNTIYILTNDYETADKISKKLGDYTLNSTSRSGQTLSFNKSKTESVDARNLLTSNELMRLKEGESVVIRVIKRQDNERKRIEAYPIYNRNKTALKYRWEYLGEEFDTDKSILDLDIESLHREVDPKSLLVDFSKQKKKVKEPEKAVEQPSKRQPEVEPETQTQVYTEVKPESSETQSIENRDWKSVTFEEFFESNQPFLELIEQQIVDKLERNFEEIKKEKFITVWEEIKMLGTTDQIDKALYRTFTAIAKKIKSEMESEPSV